MGDYYKNTGVEDVTIKVYPDARHELVNEFNKDEVIDDMIAWLNMNITVRV